MSGRKPKRTGRLPAEMAALIPDRLLDAATALFSEVGYANTTMDAIARKAGASSKTVYSRYANKQEVLEAVVRRLMDRTIAASGVETNADRLPGGPRASLLCIGKEMAALSAGPETVGFRRLIMSEAYQFPALAQLFIDLHERAIVVVRGALERWQSEGKLTNLPEPVAALIFVEMVASIPRIRALLGQPLSSKETREMVTASVDLFLRGCGYHAPAR